MFMTLVVGSDCHMGSNLENWRIGFWNKKFELHLAFTMNVYWQCKVKLTWRCLWMEAICKVAILRILNQAQESFLGSS
jgi:hypothetical protein